MYQFAELPPSRSPIEQRTAENMQRLLRHKYFEACRKKTFSRQQMLTIVKHLYCFSIYFERVITHRIARYKSDSSAEVLRLARQHLKEEIGHADLFRNCLLKNGMTDQEIGALVPKVFTKAMFGYLMATVDYENEFIGNMVIMQVMETIGFHFFGNTLQMMQHHQLSDVAFIAHTADDEHHAKLGLELYDKLGDQEVKQAIGVMDDCFKLMGNVFDEWMEDAA